jgi:uncharacterized FlaG/YvyC family protein
MYVKKNRETERENRSEQHRDRNDVGQMIKELNHAIDKKKKANDEKHIENEREREKEIKIICCSNRKTASAYFQLPSYLGTHIYKTIEDVICIFYEQVKKRRRRRNDLFFLLFFAYFV